MQYAIVGYQFCILQNFCILFAMLKNKNIDFSLFLIFFSCKIAKKIAKFALKKVLTFYEKYDMHQ